MVETPIALSKTSILDFLENTFAKNIEIHIYDHIDSTNRFLKTMPTQTKIYSQQLSFQLCCAEMQTEGHGRFGRRWQSPYKQNIYCSFRYSFQCPSTTFSGLSLIVAMAIIASLGTTIPTQDLRIKWPNDIYWNHKKLCGILIELIPISTHHTDIIIGIGINVHSTEKDMPDLTSPWCSLAMIYTEQRYDRNYIISQLCVSLTKYLEIFTTHGLPSFTQGWKALDYLYQQPISVCLPTETLSGIGLGIDDEGQLLLQEGSGRIRTIVSGEASIKKHS